LAVRIGLAFNLKPEAPANPAGANSDSPSSDEPPSRALRPDLHQPDLYAEWDEPATIDAVERALSTVGQVYRLEADSHFPSRLALLRPDFVFNIAEGLYGASREAHVPAICEFLGIPSHASDSLTCGLALHKGRTKEILSYRGVPTAPFVVAHSPADARRVSLPFPLFVKPAYEGSGKGVTTRSFCKNRSQLVRQVSHLIATYSEPVMIETYLPGEEFTVAILGNGDEARCLPIIGMRFDTLPKGAPPIYGYEAKWIWDTPEAPLKMFECPARVDDALGDAIARVSLDAFHALGCRDWSRVDVRLDGQGRPHVLEINPLPGILPRPEQNSCFPKAARAAGISYDQVVTAVLDAALARTGRTAVGA
jgi:D-alanine-D-alanine ligase